MSTQPAGPPPTAAAPLLEVRDLHHWFGGLHVISGVSFSCRAGIVKAIIGPNGAGKTTLFNLVAGTMAPVSGTILFEGRHTTGLAPHRIASRGICRTFQATRLFPGMTVREESRILAACRCILEELGIGELAQRDALGLPFGRQRVVEIARALAAEPRLLLLDEPACGLNPRETEEMAEIISRIRGRGVTVLVVEHDMSLVMGISDEVMVLSYGETIAEGTPREIQANPAVVSVYLGADDA